MKLDTNGLLPDVADSFSIDYLALDIKTLPSRYRRLAGAACDDVEERLQRGLDRVRDMGDDAEVRITVAPGFVDTASGDYRLPATSDLVDAGVVIPGINDDYVGSGPDIGAHEYREPGDVHLYLPMALR